MTWCASWRYYSSENLVSRLVYMGMRCGQQGDVTSILINVGHTGITNRELDMFALRKIQLERWCVFSNFVMCEMADQCHGSAMERISTWLIQVADNICSKYTAFDVCWHTTVSPVTCFETALLKSFCTSITRSYDRHAKGEECGYSWFLLIIGM